MTSSFTYRPDHAGQARLVGSAGGPTGRRFIRLANRVVSTAKGLAPVDTGLLRSRIEMQVVGENPLEIDVVAGTNYARYVHDGTRYMPGNPFLTDAAHIEFAAP